LLPVAIGFGYVGRFGVNVVYFDQWEMVPLFDKLSSGDLTFSDLFAQHVQHRMFFPKLAMLALGSLTSYDNVAEMYLILCCFLVTVLCVIAAFGRRTPALALIPVGFLVFSLRQFENMLWGWQVSFAFAQVFSILTFFLIHRLRGGAATGVMLLAASASATVAAFSAVQGLWAWPVGAVQLLLAPLDKKTKRFSALAWISGGTGVWALYFLGYSLPAQGQPLAYVFEQPASAARFMLALLGNSLFWHQDLATTGGAVLLFLAITALFLIYRRGGWGAYSFWIALLLFSLATLVTIAAGRAELGLTQASLSRYSTFSLPTVLATYGLLVERFLDDRGTRGVRRWLSSAILLGILCAVIVPSVPISYARGMAAGERTREVRETAAIVLGTYEFQPEEHITDYLYPRSETVKNRAPVLERLNYNVFADGRNPTNTSSRTPPNRHRG
jgi:hypothetical protein